jgi:hypothetical protein
MGQAVETTQRDDDGDEERQDQHGRQVGNGRVAHQQHDVLRCDIAAGCLAQRTDQRRRQHDGQDDHQGDAKALGQFGPRG